MTRNPFVVDVLQLPEEGCSTMKDDFHRLTVEQFWIKRLPVNSKLAFLDLRSLKLNSEIVLMSIAT
nr:unnamed protein product [Callosobruchus analis]